ncbi:MAG: hypothetical protein AAF703_17840 [Cyanobacteria bacterium P01_D01_bin.105]
MVPDFSKLRLHSCDRTAQQSSKPSPHKGFDSKKSFQQFNTNSSQALKTPDSCGVDHTFFHLWLAQPSWCPIILTDGRGWRTVKSPSGKKVPLTLGSIESHYRRGVVIGKRFGKLTTYLMVDIDAGSVHHPNNDGLGLILAALEEIGLCRFLTVRSSDSGGLHLYFPLPTAVNAWALARTVHAALSGAGVHVRNGQCELFPNKKMLGSEHHGHRLPLQAGSFLLDEDFRCIGNDRALFLRHWQLCAANQDEALLTLAFEDRPRVTASQLRVFPPIAWTAPGQSNDVLRQLVNYGDRVMGLKTIPELGDWMTEIAPRLPGYDRFASLETKKDLSRKDWAYRWAKSHFKSCWQYAAEVSLDYNATVAAQAKGRLLAALDEVGVIGKVGVTQLWRMLSEVTQRLYGMGVSWKVFSKYKRMVLASVEGSRNLGLSRGNEEDKKLLNQEKRAARESEGIQKRKNAPTKLLTSRCVTSSNGKGLSSFNTPIQRGEGQEGGQRDIERLRKAVEGNDAERGFEGSQAFVEGAMAQVPGEAGKKTGAVIKATAAQLVQVLGKACPFVGPGLWTVRRDQVTAQAWGQLCTLVGEM